MKKHYYFNINLLLMAFTTLMFVAACEEEQEETDEPQEEIEVNEAPDCIVFEPLAGAEFAEGDTITIIISVNDPDDNLSRVDIHVDDSMISSINESPFRTKWMTAGESLGSHLIHVVAVDEEGLQASDSIDINLKKGIEWGNGVTDIDGNTYQTVIIGEQEWMAENLKTITYNDGEPIELAVSDSAWSNNTTGAYCWYDNNEYLYADTYGPLYNGHAVITGNLCPDGWHVPSDDDWKTLEMELGMSQADADTSFADRGINEGSKLAGFANLWGYSNTISQDSEFGTSGFNGLPGKFRHGGGTFFNPLCGYYLSSTTNGVDDVWMRALYSISTRISRFSLTKRRGVSVRCVKN